MHTLEEYITQEGEVLDRQGVIERIEMLLNRVDSKHLSYFSPEVINALDFSSLTSILQGLENKSGKEIQNNQEWLFGLIE